MPTPPSAAPLSRRAFFALTAGAGAALAASPAAAAPRSRLIDEKWNAFGADAGPDHGAWTGLLRRYRRVDAAGVARFDYASASAADRMTLADYLAALQTIDPTKLTNTAAFAYWGNLYNAKTVDLVLEAYPVRSIKNVRGGLFNTGPWTDKVMTVNGVRLSLDDVEHGIMRPIWNDPRIHYMVNCAAIGCPNLQGRAWEAGSLEADLDAAARDYVNDPRGVRFDGDRLNVSSIYEWFQEDFGGDDAGVIRHLAAYAEPALADQLASAASIYDDFYDWSLNAVA